jgi:hypothetical protein
MTSLVDQIWNAVAENPHVMIVEPFDVTQSFVSLRIVVQMSRTQCLRLGKQ